MISNESTRPAAVAGLFYEGDPARLAADIDRLLAQTGVVPEPPTHQAIVPHAGLRYSGPIAASAYRALRSALATATRVVVLGPSHRVAFHGLALSSATAFRTPLGDMPLDRAIIDRLEAEGLAEVHDDAHALEHSIEVHLPFLQRLAPQARLVPIVVGDASAEAVGRVLDAVATAPGTVLVVSSDLSHYHSYEMARSRDRETAEAIVAGRTDLHPGQACGCRAVNGLNRWLRRRSGHLQLVDLRNSGDTAGDRERVVGYGAFVVVDGSNGETRDA